MDVVVSEDREITFYLCGLALTWTSAMICEYKSVY